MWEIRNDISAFSALSPRTSRASLVSGSLLPPRTPQSPQDKCSLLCGATLPSQAAPCKVRVPWRPNPREASVSSATQLPFGTATDGQDHTGYLSWLLFCCCDKNPKNQGHLWKGLFGLMAQRDKSLPPPWQGSVALGRHSSSTAESSRLNHKGADTSGRHWGW